MRTDIWTLIERRDRQRRYLRIVWLRVVLVALFTVAVVAIQLKAG